MATRAVEWWSEPLRRRCRAWRRAEALAEPDAPFRRLLGEAAWRELPEAVRRRVARHNAAGACVS